MRVLVLGHEGMLGHMVDKYFTSQGLVVFTMPARWPNNDFKDAILNNLGDIEYIVNCIAAIPQHKKYKFEDYINTNVSLPVWLAKNFKGKIIHPTTDGEFSGNINSHEKYNKNDIKDARDDYGLSKIISSVTLELFSNVIQIRASIIGPEEKNKVSLLEWFLSQKEEAKGYSNHLWNGITTLEWSKLALLIMENWDTYHKDYKIIQVGTKPISKFDLLCLINKVFDSNKTVVSVEKNYCNKCLESDFLIKSLEDQLTELKKLCYF